MNAVVRIQTIPPLLAALIDGGAMPVSLTSNEPEIRARVFERLSRTLEQDQVRRGVFKDFPPLLKATFAASYVRNGNKRFSEHTVRPDFQELKPQKRRPPCPLEERK